MEPTVPTIVSEPTPTLAQKPKVDIVKILLAIIISAVISGGFVWY